MSLIEGCSVIVELVVIVVSLNVLRTKLIKFVLRKSTQLVLLQNDMHGSIMHVLWNNVCVDV